MNLSHFKYIYHSKVLPWHPPGPPPKQKAPLSFHFLIRRATLFSHLEALAVRLGMNGNGINKICLIQKLGHMVRKPHDHEHRASPTIGCSLSPRCSRRSSFFYDSDEDLCTSPSDVPEGYLAVYVGRERKRFIIPTGYLSRPVFRTLLQRAEEEFGFGYKGGLLIPCEVSVFQNVLRVLQRNDSAERTLSVDGLPRNRGSQAYYSKEQKLSVDELLTDRGSRDYYSKIFSPNSSSGSSRASSALLRSSLPKSFG